MRAGVRAAVLWLLRWSGFMWLWRLLHRRRVAILFFHGVMDDRAGPAWTPLRPRVSREALRRQLRALARHYHFVSLSDAAQMLSGRAPLKPNSVVLTFDDGYRNNVTHALPILREFGAPMTMFLPTGMIDRRALFAFDRFDYALQRIAMPSVSLAVGTRQFTLRTVPRNELQSAFAGLRVWLKAQLGADLESCEQMTGAIRACEAAAGGSLGESGETDDWVALVDWADVARLAPDGMVEFGSHTVNHVRLALADPETVRDELHRSRQRIEEMTGRPCRLLAYPDGSYDATVAEAAREEGYVCAVTTEEGLNWPGDDLMRLRRISVPGDAGVTETLSRVSGLSHALSARDPLLGGRGSEGASKGASPNWRSAAADQENRGEGIGNPDGESRRHPCRAGRKAK